MRAQGQAPEESPSGQPPGTTNRQPPPTAKGATGEQTGSKTTSDRGPRGRRTADGPSPRGSPRAPRPGLRLRGRRSERTAMGRACPTQTDTARLTTPAAPRALHTAARRGTAAYEGRGGGGDGKGPHRRFRKRLDGRVEEVAEGGTGGYCRLQMPWRPALAVRGIAVREAARGRSPVPRQTAQAPPPPSPA